MTAPLAYLSHVRSAVRLATLRAGVPEARPEGTRCRGESCQDTSEPTEGVEARTFLYLRATLATLRADGAAAAGASMDTEKELAI